MTVLLPTASFPLSWFSKCTDKEGCLLPGRSRKGSCWLWEVLFGVDASSGGETASWVTARDWETQQLSVSPARAACCLLRLIPQWNPSTNPIDGPPLLYQPKQNSLLTTSRSLVEQQDESLFWIFFFFFLQGGFIQQTSIFLHSVVGKKSIVLYRPLQVKPLHSKMLPFEELLAKCIKMID